MSKQKKYLVIKDIVAKSKLWEKTKVTTTLFDNFCGHEFFLVKDGLASFEIETLHTISENMLEVSIEYLIRRDFLFTYILIFELYIN